MKNVKKLATLLLALALLLVLLPVYQANALTYAPVKTSVTTLGLNEKLEVVENGAVNPAVTYTLKLGSAITAFNDGTETYGDTSEVTNALANGTVIGTVSWAASAIAGIGSDTKPYDDTAFVALLNNMEFDRPGIYYWTIDKEITSLSTNFTNYNRSQSSSTGTALVVRVDDVSGVLTPSVNMVVLDSSGKPTGNKETTYEDNYTAKVGNLILKKEITGNQGAKDQYFKFHIEVSGLPGLAGHTYAVTTTNGPGITATPKYGENGDNIYTNPTSFTLDSSGAASGDVWLQDQEEIIVENMPQGATIKITESDNAGYTVTYSYDNGSTVTNGTGNVVDTTMPSGANLRVVYKNDRASTVPTGVTLETMAPLAGVVVALALGAVLIVSRRRRSSKAR